MAPTGPASGWVTPAPPGAGRGSRRRWLFGCAAVVVVAVIIGVILVSALSRGFASGFAVMQASGGDIDSFRVFSNGASTTITFQAARGVDLPDGPRLACEVVRPTLATTDWAGTRWVVVNRAGDVIASDQTPCD